MNLAPLSVLFRDDRREQAMFVSLVALLSGLMFFGFVSCAEVTPRTAPKGYREPTVSVEPGGDGLSHLRVRNNVDVEAMVSVSCDGRRTDGIRVPPLGVVDFLRRSEGPCELVHWFVMVR